MCNYKNKPLLCSDCDKSFNMPKKFKEKKFCPADYNDAEQSDSDQHDDPDYINEPTSPKISQGKGGCETFQKRQMEKSMKSTATPKSTKGGQTSPATPSSPSSETSAGKRKRARALNLQSKLDSLLASQRKLQAKRTRRVNIFDEVEQIQVGLQANRDRITATTQAEEDDETTRPPSQ